MNIEDARAGLAAGLAATGIDRVYDTEPDSVEVPCFVVGNPTWTYDDDFDGDVTWVFPLVLLVSRAADSQRAIVKCQPFCNPTGAQSVRAALQGFAEARVAGGGQFGGGYTVGTDDYVGVTFEAQVI